ncbi:lipase family protein [Chitinimonas lacunae]|uniref:Fungal lipase-type domain-containing protein n=1 Tax=Chitinimonas lacunae TaxID=1963018 RepID=A0ABV8MXI5_9NEIS
MSTVNLNPTSAQMLQTLQSPYYGMVFLGLAAQAYTAEGDWSKIPLALYTALTQTQYTPSLPAPGQAGVDSPQALAGAWSLDWGPANGQDGSGDNSNLLYIASYRAQNNPNYEKNWPYFFVVAIRGTDTSAGPLALWKQLGEDLGDFNLTSWAGLVSNGQIPIPNSSDTSSLSGNIANGTSDGFTVLATSTAPLNNGQPPSSNGTPLSLIAALNSLLQQYPNTPVVVTGHSLGGAQSQPIAAYLGWQLSGITTVMAQPFAPPTAGDQGFINTYQSFCPNSYFWYNTLDLIPYAYITMGSQSGLQWANQNLWTSYEWPGGSTSGPSLPSLLSGLIDVFGNDIPSSYVRPSSGVQALQGSLPQQTQIQQFLNGMGFPWDLLSWNGSDAQLAWQHFPPSYFAYMSSQYGSSIVNYMTTPYKPS